MAKEFSWNNPNGNRIYAVEWPVADARAVLGIVHGVGEHCRRYDELVAWFNERGIAAVGYDRQGFGRSEGKQGHSASYSELLDEISHLVVECERRYPDTPVFLYGQSMGGQLTLQYLIRRNPHISGAVVTSPHIQLAFAPSKILVGIGKLTRRVAPSFTQATPLDLDALSRDKSVGEAYAEDPYTHLKISSQLGLDMLESGFELDEWVGRLPVPTLLMHGTADRITGFEGSKAFAERNPKGLTFKAWEEFYHELHNEPERQEVLNFVLNWIEKHLGAVHRPPESV